MLYDADVAAQVRANVRDFAHTYRWSLVLRPLIEFCRAPRRAVDLAVSLGAPIVALRAVVPPLISFKGDVRLVKHYLEAGGVRELARRAGGRVRRVAGRRTSG